MSPRLVFDRVLGLILLALLWIPTNFIGDTIHLGIRFTLILLTSWQLGELILPGERTAPVRYIVGLSAWMSLFAILLTGTYYLTISLTGTVHQIIESGFALIVTGIFFFFPSKTELCETEPPPEARSTIWLRRMFLACLAVGALLASVLTIRVFATHGTLISVQTPWTLLPKGILLAMTVPFFASMVIAWKTRSSLWLGVCAFASWLSVTLLTPLLYPLGYGFDGFIHRASESVLQTTGLLTPKPLYYIGQYVWTTWIAQTFDLPLHAVDVWLLPIAIILPLSALLLWMRTSGAEYRWSAVLTLLFLPLNAFVTTTPQSFAYLLGFTAIIATLWAHAQIHRHAWAVPLLLAVWSTITHPLGGLPMLCFAGGAWLGSFFEGTWKRTAFLTLGSVAGLAAIPAAFWMQSRLGALPITWSWEALSQLDWNTILPPLLLQPRQTLTFWVDATEWTRLATHLFLFGIGIWQFIRPQKPFFRSLAFFGIGLLVVQWLLAHIATFGFLISYERNNYTERLGVLSMLFLAPLAASWMSTRLDALSKRSMVLFGCVFAILISVWPLRVYDAFPRQDAASSSSGWNVSMADLDAVRWIHEQEQTKKYTVLANQSVSAAALETYGFTRYVNDVFYYPIPTSGPLYQLFLRVASTDGTMKDIKEAAQLTESQDVFVVIDSYWWNANLINERLAKTADQAISFGDGKVWVYRFRILP